MTPCLVIDLDPPFWGFLAFWITYGTSMISARIGGRWDPSVSDNITASSLSTTPLLIGMFQPLLASLGVLALVQLVAFIEVPALECLLSLCLHIVLTSLNFLLKFYRGVPLSVYAHWNWHHFSTGFVTHFISSELLIEAFSIYITAPLSYHNFA